MLRNELKQAIRREMLRKRAFLTTETCQQASLELAMHLQAFLEIHFPHVNEATADTGFDACAAASPPKSLHIAVYAAMRNELDLSPCWEFLKDWPAVLYFPAVIKGADASDRLWFAPVPAQMKPEDLLSPGTFGVPEPPPEVCLAPEDLPLLDLVLVPGLAFDREGNRIGWGKAYYDGFIACLRSKALLTESHNDDTNHPMPLCIGICYDFQFLDQELPHDDHDQPLQGVLTPSGWRPVQPSHPSQSS